MGATKKWTYETCKEEASKYAKLKDFRIAKNRAYLVSVRNGWIDEFFKDKIKGNGYWNNKEHVLEAAARCKNAKDMSKRYGGAYRSASVHGWTKELKYKDEDNNNDNGLQA